MRTLRVLAALAVISVLAGAVLLAGCGSSGGGGGGMKTYANSDYKFSITYDGGKLSQGSSATTGSGAGATPVFKVGFADKSSADDQGIAVDGLLVQVYKLQREVKPEEVPGLKSVFEGLIPQLQAGLGSGAKMGQLTSAEVNALPGFRIEYTFLGSDGTVKSITYFLIKGQYEYELTAQAREKTWPNLEAIFTSAIDSFKVSD